MCKREQILSQPPLMGRLKQLFNERMVDDYLLIQVLADITKRPDGQTNDGTTLCKPQEQCDGHDLFEQPLGQALYIFKTVPQVLEVLAQLLSPS